MLLVCLLFRFFQLHPMFHVAFLFVLKHPPAPPPPPYHSPPPILHHFRSGCQSALLIFKSCRARNRHSEHGPDFHSLIMPSDFPFEKACFVYFFLFTGGITNRHATGYYVPTSNTKCFMLFYRINYCHGTRRCLRSHILSTVKIMYLELRGSSFLTKLSH